MSQVFDAYHVWLGIPPAEQPPNHYRLLGLRLFENNPEVIDNAARRVAAHVGSFQSGPYQLVAQRVLSDIQLAHSVLLEPHRKASYDQALSAHLQPATAGPVVVQMPPMPAAAQRPVPLSAPQARKPGQATAESKPAPAPSLSSLIPQPVKVVLGGIAGLAMGYVVVYFIQGDDMLGLLPSRNKPEPRPAVVTAPPPSGMRRSQPERQPRPNRKTAPPASYIPPPQVTVDTEPQPADPPTQFNTPPNPFNTEPKTGSDSTNDTPQPRPLVNTAPLPGTPGAALPKPKVAAKKKHPQPSAEERAKMLAELQSIYDDEFDKGLKPDGRQAFVAFLFDTARKMEAEPVAQFVLYREAYDRGMGQKDFVTVAEVIDHLERGFDVDGYRLRLHLLTEASRAARSPDERVPLLHFVFDMAEHAQAAQKIDELPKLANMADGLARSVNNKELKALATSRANAWSKAAEDYRPVAAARARLAEEPTNPAASLIDGKYRALTLGDWPEGLRLLAQSDHAALAAAAKQDLAGPGGDVSLADIGDLWFDIAEADPALLGAYARAQHWYQQAAGDLDGLDKVKVDKRLAKIAELNLPARLTAPEQTGNAELPSARYLLTRMKPFQPTDLIAAVTPQTPHTAGWTVPSNPLNVNSQAQWARLQAPVNPTGEYQVAVRVRRYTTSTSQAGVFVIGLPHPRSQFLVVLDYPLPGKGYASFMTLSGFKSLADNPTLKVTGTLERRIDTGNEHTILCAVKLTEIVVQLDGQPLIEYRGDMSKLTMLKEWAVPDSRALFLGSHQGGFWITGWHIAPLRAEDGSELPLDPDPFNKRLPSFAP